MTTMIRRNDKHRPLQVSGTISYSWPEEEIRTEQDHEEKKEKGINKQKIFGHLLITIHGPFSISSPLTTMVNGGGGGEEEEVEEFNSQSHLMITCLSAAAHFRSLRFN